MKTKLLTFACILLAGMMINVNTSTVKADEITTTDAAIEVLDEEEIEAEEPDEEDDGLDEEVEELEVDEDDSPLGEAEEVQDKKADKKTDKTSKPDKTPKSVVKYTDEEFKILACVTYLEAGNQPYKGKLATANVVLNRVLNKNFPNTIKSVIYQRYNGSYQFSLCKPGGRLDQAMKVFGKRTGLAAAYEKECVKACKAALEGKMATDRKYHFFRVHYKGIENWKSDGIKIANTYFYNY